ncbi:PqqD family protein [Terrihabitans rhizophilus]|uniref:PqqD family protein n=1 Tax=Terrihabitans rhizophilus TaxID=3092662 RepID=A0ABU4RRZ4_9HYPH|nr:PqqD family protein [Terrihabitans sp. PJ23]MDX6806953.1 PqqD family protein [Terrihabitans sp. PJ23]
MNEATVLKISAPASFQKLGDGAVVLMADSGQLYTGNETTEAFLAAVDGKRTIGEIADRMMSEFDVQRDVLARDLIDLAGDLASEQIVEDVRHLAE